MFFFSNEWNAHVVSTVPSSDCDLIGFTNELILIWIKFKFIWKKRQTFDSFKFVELSTGF